VLTSASETLRVPGIDADINASGRYHAVKPRVLAMGSVTGADEIRRLHAGPDAIAGSFVAITATGSLVAASANGSTRLSAHVVLKYGIECSCRSVPYSRPAHDGATAVGLVELIDV